MFEKTSRTKANADVPLAGRSAAKNAARRVAKLAAVETANRAAVQMGGWGLPDEAVDAMEVFLRAKGAK